MSNRFPFLCVLATLVLVLLPHPSHAQDRLFTYTYQTNILPPGKAEIEVWNTIRWQRADYYRALDHRIEFEIGVAKQLQTSFYLNIGTKSFKALTSDYSTDAAGRLVIASIPAIQTETDISFSNEWKYKLADPVADNLGFALYGEFTIGRRSAEIEAKIIVDKTLGEFLTAFNAVGEFESEIELNNKGDVTSEKEFALEFDYGLMYTVHQDFHVGFEAVNLNKFNSREWKHSALFMGPAFSYTADAFWVNLTILPQVAGLKGATKEGLVLNELERLHTRLLFSYAL